MSERDGTHTEIQSMHFHYISSNIDVQFFLYNSLTRWQNQQAVRELDFKLPATRVMYLSTDNSISSIEVFTVHMHGASFALCNTSSSACKRKIHKWAMCVRLNIGWSWELISGFVRLTSELSHDLLHSPSSGVSVAVGTVCSDEVIIPINRRLNSNRTSFLWGRTNSWKRGGTCGNIIFNI